MNRKFGNHWVEYRDPIDMMHRSWTTISGHVILQIILMVDFETIIAFASMTYIIDL